MAFDSGGIGSERAQPLPSASAEGLALLVSKEVAQVQKEITTELRERPAREEEDIVDVKNAKTEELAAASAAGDASNDKNATSDSKKEKADSNAGSVVSITV